MWIKFICPVLLASPWPALGIHLFCGSQACSPNHLSSQHPDSQPHIESSGGPEGRSFGRHSNSDASHKSSCNEEMPWGGHGVGPGGLSGPFLCPCPRALAAPWHEHSLTALTWPCPFFPTFQWLREEEDVEWGVETSSRSEDKFICWTELCHYYFLLGYLGSGGCVLMYMF